jgi:lysozyme
LAQARFVSARLRQIHPAADPLDDRQRRYTQRHGEDAEDPRAALRVIRPIPVEPCLGLIHAFEKGPEGSFAATPYKDPVGVWTIGWGHALQTEDAGAPYPWTEARADQQALVDLATAAEGVYAALGGLTADGLTDGQYAACIDFAFNAGVSNFSNSTLCLRIKSGQLSAVPNEFNRWVYGRVNGVETKLMGLVARRAAEVRVWLT